MRCRRRGRFQALAGLLEIPQDIVLDLPRITMLGNTQLLIENHKGIIEFDPCVVRVRLTQAELIIRGEKLGLSNLQMEQILIEGIIFEMKYET